MAARGELSGSIFTIDCTLLASALHLALAGLAGCREAARGELAGFIFTIDCTPPGIWPWLGVGWRRAGNPPASLSLTGL